MKKSIEVTINDQKVILFYGATLKNALLKVDEKLYEQVMSKKAEIRDQFGNLVEIKGAVDDRFTYTIVSKAEE